MKVIRKERIPNGEHLVFATRPCCGPDGVGACISRKEGLPCGMAMRTTYLPPPGEDRVKAEEVRVLRRSLGLTLRDMASLFDDGLVSTASDIELGAATVENWDELFELMKGMKRT